MRSLRRYQIVLMGLSCGYETQAPCLATRSRGKLHSPGPATGAVNVVAYSNDFVLNLGMAAAGEMNGCQEREDLGRMDHGVKKDLQD